MYGGMFPDNLLFPSGSILFNGKGADADIVVFSPEEADEEVLKAKGFVSCAGEGKYEGEEDTFSAWRKGGINVILVYTKKDYNSFKEATALCQHLAQEIGAIDKPTRVHIHRWFREKV